jgi:hypothetical protein
MIFSLDRIHGISLDVGVFTTMYNLMPNPLRNQKNICR